MKKILLVLLAGILTCQPVIASNLLKQKLKQDLHASRQSYLYMKWKADKDAERNLLEATYERFRDRGEEARGRVQEFYWDVDRIRYSAQLSFEKSAVRGSDPNRRLYLVSHYTEEKYLILTKETQTQVSRTTTAAQTPTTLTAELQRALQERSWWESAVRISKSIHGEIHQREDKFGTNIYRKDVDGTLAYAKAEKEWADEEYDRASELLTYYSDESIERRRVATHEAAEMYYEERNRGIMERYEAVEMAFREIESKEIRKVKFLFKESVMIQNLRDIILRK
jgi:hypothetical protein